MTEPNPTKTTGLRLIGAERNRQQRKLGWTKAHDQEQHGYGQLAEMGAFLASPAKRRATFGEERNPRVAVVRDLGWDITPHDRINELVKAGALIAAEIDRLLAEGNRE